MVDASYSGEIAQEILETAGVLNKYVAFKKAGVFPAKALKRPKRKEPSEPAGKEPRERVLLKWRPAKVMTKARGAPSTNDTPMLPPEFSGRELAAFMLAGTGAAVADFFGDWEDGPDPARLELLDEDSGAREAVEDAFTAYREAVERVGQPDLALAARMYEAHKAYRKARTDAMGRHGLEDVPQAKAGDRDERRHELDAEYQRRLALVEGDVSGLEAEMNSLKEKNDDAEKAWLRAMVAELLKPDTGPAEPVAEPAPQAGPVWQAGPDEDLTQDSERRLARLRELGGSAKYKNSAWKFTGISALVEREKSEGRKRSDEKTIRADLKEAAQDELDARRAGAFTGLGAR